MAEAKISFFTKAKRAQNVDDYETWIQGGLVPTLNAMDNSGDSFATVLILMEEGKPVIMRNREGCAGGGKGLMYNNKSFTLKADNDQFLIIDGTRVDDVRVYEDGIVPTVISRYGTGGGNVPMIFPIQGTVVGRADTSGPQGKGYAEDETMFTLTKTDIHAIAIDTYNQTTNETTSQALRSAASDVDHIGAVMSQSVVRRLTPTECERLQGFPDNWTDGQADSNRYKQMGNAVAVPVVQWIINRMIAE